MSRTHVTNAYISQGPFESMCGVAIQVTSRTHTYDHQINIGSWDFEQDHLVATNSHICHEQLAHICHTFVTNNSHTFVTHLSRTTRTNLTHAHTCHKFTSRTHTYHRGNWVNIRGWDFEWDHLFATTSHICHELTHMSRTHVTNSYIWQGPLSHYQGLGFWIRPSIFHELTHMLPTLITNSCHELIHMTGAIESTSGVGILNKTIYLGGEERRGAYVLQCVAVCCSMLQCE